jgi:hypothetical protein
MSRDVKRHPEERLSIVDCPSEEGVGNEKSEDL